MRKALSAYVVGSGPNGLSAAILLARAGIHTTVLEAESSIGGGARSAALTLPGFTHDICSAVHPMALASPVFRSFPLAEHGLEWIQPTVPLAHPLDGGSAVIVERSADLTAQRMGPDALPWRRTLGSIAAACSELLGDILGPLGIPKHPLVLARFGPLALLPATWAARFLFQTMEARAVFAGVAAHSILPLEQPLSASFGLVLLVLAHAVGWPVPRGGSQSIANALASYFESLGGQIAINTRVRSLEEISDADLILCDITPRQLLRIAGDRLPVWYSRKLEAYRYGPGVFKMDLALSGPIPWKAPECALAGTVHLGGSMEEIAASERAPSQGVAPAHPFVLLVQPSLFDGSRAPAGQHTVWAYCHVPNGSTEDMSERIEAQIERFAPGFRQRVLARNTLNTMQLQAHNENLQGGDVVGGSMDIRQTLTRPTRKLYRTPLPRLYLCSSSTPPGGGVHGMCGYWAATRALADLGASRPL